MNFFVKSFSVAVTASAISMACPASAGAPQGETDPISEVSPERLELARRFIRATEPAGDMMEALRAGYWNAASRHIKDEDRAVAEEKLKRLLARLEPHVRKAMPKLLDSYALVYAREFSAGELRQLVTFADSPVGKRYLSQAAALEGDPSILAAQSEFMAGLAPMIVEFSRKTCVEDAAKRLAAEDGGAECPDSLEPEPS